MVECLLCSINIPQIRLLRLQHEKMNEYFQNRQSEGTTCNLGNRMGGSKPRTYFSELTVFKAVLYTVAIIYFLLANLVAFIEVREFAVADGNLKRGRLLRISSAPEAFLHQTEPYQVCVSFHLHLELTCDK